MKNQALRIFSAAVLAIACSLTTSAVASEKVLHTFTAGKDGIGPYYGLVADAAGNLYATTVLGGVYGYGTIFKLTPTASGPWKETILYHFIGGRDGANPTWLALDSAGNLYGVAQAKGKPTRGTPACQANGCGTLFRLSPGANGWTFNLLHAFTGVSDGMYPVGVTLDAAGNVFVTTHEGETNTGAVFEMVGGTQGRSIYTFSQTDSSNGANPVGPVAIDAAGNLFGAALGGTTFAGVIYELTPGSQGQWTETAIHTFAFSTSDGAAPTGKLAFDSSGNLYGVTQYNGGYNEGVAYRLTPDSGGGWVETILYNFTGYSDGGNPLAGITLDTAGNVYGTTEYGGNTACSLGCGVVFKLTPSSSGWTETVLAALNGTNDGYSPFFGGVVLDPSGNVYSTTSSGGKVSAACTFGCGVAFEIPSATAAGVK